MEYGAFGRYLVETGTSQRWLAEKVGVSTTMVCRWAQGASISPANQEAVVAALRERAELALDNLFSDQADWVEPTDRRGSMRNRVASRHTSGTPFDQFLSERRAAA